MIATLSGNVQSVSGESCIIEVHGVGYQVLMPLPALEALSRTTEPVTVYTHFHLREDAATLFGFLSVEEKTVFEKIINVSGIGPKTALAILGTLSGEQFAAAIHQEDHRALTGVSGIGLKTAQRLILELKGKIAWIATTGNVGGPAKTVPAHRSCDDAVDALVALGYAQKEAVTTVETITQAEPGLTTPELVRRALKNLGSRPR